MLIPEITDRLATISGWVVGSTTGSVAIWGGYDPDSPGDTIVVYESYGMQPAEVMQSTKAAFERPRIQVMSRSTGYATARTNAEKAMRSLRGVVNTNLVSGTSTAFYQWIQPLQSPFFAGRDHNGRVLISCNYQVMRTST